MKAGDLVRFKYTKSDQNGWKIGLLTEYHTWEKIATVLYAGNMVRIRAADVTKTGKKDELNNDKCR